ncbi:MAG: hypothetical protein GXP55_20730, partial [Deltaproteobacteria bacterium]|nr:hypothetical protein [Deltaproteobacteria bacterium]
MTEIHTDPAHMDGRAMNTSCLGRMTLRTAIALLVFSLGLGCAANPPRFPLDSGVGDADTIMDAGSRDSSRLDSARPDTGAVDSGAVDSGAVDSGAV